MAARKTSPSGRSFMLPLLWVILLIAVYWLLSEWRSLPSLLASLKLGFLH